MAVEDWFLGFLGRHMGRHPRTDWPRPSERPEFYAGWRKAFVSSGVTEEVADEASTRLMVEPPEFVAGHLPALLKASKSVLAERAAAEVDIASARAASRDCPDCAGEGLTYVHSLGAVAYCHCPAGRFVEANHRQHCPEVRGRIRDLARR